MDCGPHSLSLLVWRRQALDVVRWDWSGWILSSTNLVVASVGSDRYSPTPPTCRLGGWIPTPLPPYPTQPPAAHTNVFLCLSLLFRRSFSANTTVCVLVLEDSSSGSIRILSRISRIVRYVFITPGGTSSSTNTKYPKRVAL